MSSFVYDAPDFFDFSKDLGNEEDPQKVEAFFETEHEKHNGIVPGKQAPGDEDKELEQEFYTPLKLTPEKKHFENRRSVSMLNLANDETVTDEVDEVSEALERLNVSPMKKLATSTRKVRSHNMTTRANAPKLNLRSRSISRVCDSIDRLAQPKRKNVSHEDLLAKKYLSMAEAVNIFHQKTPQRFHTTSKSAPNPALKAFGPLFTTIPQSPALATKQRARPVHVMSREEKELKEYEEAKKFRIKANPVNTKILNGPMQLHCVDKKPATKPEPFNLTDVHTKKAPSSPKAEAFEFHAKPVPKAVLEPPKPVIKAHFFTVPRTPKLMKRYATADKMRNERIVENDCGKSGAQPFKPTVTKPIPFSFEERDKAIIRKRDKLLNEVLEEEKKAREFHARPLPKSIFQSPPVKSSTLYQKRQRSDGSLHKSTESLNETTFKAKPAKVLQMKPFEPKKIDTHLIEITEFQLNTERRAKEREQFELMKKQKEEMIAQLIREKEERILRQQEEEAAQLRKEMEYKAQPIRRYKEVKPVMSKKLTDPVSPKFFSKAKDKENVVSSP